MQFTNDHVSDPDTIATTTVTPNSSPNDNGLDEATGVTESDPTHDASAPSIV